MMLIRLDNLAFTSLLVIICSLISLLDLIKNLDLIAKDGYFIS